MKRKLENIPISRAKLEKVRAQWVEVAKARGWYDERIKQNKKHKFFVHIWHDGHGNIIDSLYQHPEVTTDTFSLREE